MTVEEYLTAKLAALGYTATAADLEDIVLGAGVPLEGDITADNVELVGQGLCKFIPQLLARPTSISENGFSISWNADGLKRLYAALCRRYGLTDELTDAPRINFL